MASTAEPTTESTSPTPTPTPTEIVIRNVGPNGLVTIPLAPGGGVTVLRGRNDRGKSEALKAVSVLAGGKDKLSVKRDSPLGTKGEVTGGGVRVVIHKNMRRTGEAEFEVLDGDLSVEDIVDPGIKDPIAADAKRIKALLRVANANIEPEEFCELVGGVKAFDSIVGKDDQSDPLLTAQRVRAYLHKQAREAGQDAAEADTKADGIIGAFEDIPDDGAAIDQRSLENDLEKAIANRSRVEEQIRQVEVDQQRYEQAQQQLAAAKKEYTGLTVSAATEVLNAIDKKASVAKQRVLDLQAELEQAKQIQVEMLQQRTRAAVVLDNASTHERTINRLADLVEQGRPAPPPAFALEVAESGVDEARQRIELAAKIRQKRETMATVENLRKQAASRRCQEEDARAKADRVNAILSRAVETLGSPLFVRDERVMVSINGNGDGKAVKEFDELSVGARRKIALDIAIDSIGPGGLFDFPQGAWESLDFAARHEVNEHLKARGANMVTAEADRYDDGHGGNVRAEIYEGER